MSEEAWVEVGSADDIATGSLRGAMRRGYRLCVGRDNAGFFAMDDTCPHAGASLSEGLLDGPWVVCPIHAYGFDVKTGHCEEDPSCKVRTYAVRVQDGAVQVCLDGQA